MHMNALSTIREYYHPTQPSLHQHGNQVSYTELNPQAQLRNFIYCYWELKTNQKLDEPFIYRVVADGCIDFFFELGNPEQSFVMGFCKTYTEFPLHNSFHYIGVRFLPAMFPLLFKINASELSNRFEQLENVLPKTAIFLSESFNNSISQEQIRNTLDNYFMNLVSKVEIQSDNRFFNAMDIILKNSGNNRVQKELDTGLSPRQLRRVFQYYTGDTAKTFSQVVRFQNIMRSKPSVQSLRQNKSFFDAGYYDQAHFVKEFKTFYGVTPTQAFGR